MGFFKKCVSGAFYPSVRKRYPFCGTSDGLDSLETLHIMTKPGELSRISLDSVKIPIILTLQNRQESFKISRKLHRNFQNTENLQDFFPITPLVSQYLKKMQPGIAGIPVFCSGLSGQAGLLRSA